jgi:sugar lactone lactonase YvrE
LFDVATSSIQLINDPEKQLPDNRFNDGKCDPSGRFWAGTMAKEGQGASGSLYCLEANGHVDMKLSDVICSNGLAWDTSQNKMYFIDTGRHCLDAFDYEPKSGDIRHRKTILAIPEEEGLPDGMTIDEEGKLWVALWGGGCVIRVDPENKLITDRIPLPVSMVTSCTFGGEEMSTLFITTANIDLSEEEKINEPLAGHLFTCELSVKGLESHYHKRKD